MGVWVRWRRGERERYKEERGNLDSSMGRLYWARGGVKEGFWGGLLVVWGRGIKRERGGGIREIEGGVRGFLE